MPNLFSQRQVEGDTPLFPITIADITASDKMIYGFEERAPINRFRPMNYMEIDNRSGFDINIYINGSTDPERTIFNNMTYKHTGIIHTFILENTSASATITGSLVKCRVQRRGG